ncbi:MULTISPECIES: hypothetical protein [unclassified Modestobacter]
MNASSRPLAARNGIVTAHPAGTVTARIGALIALASAVVHVVSLDASMASLAVAGMALACLPCAWHLWRAPTPGLWGTVVGVDLAMLAAHAPMVLAGGGHQTGGAAHSGMGHGSTGPGELLGFLLPTASLLLGLTVLTAALLRHRRDAGPAAGRGCPPVTPGRRAPRRS